MFKGLIFGVMLSTYVLSPDGHLTLSGDAVPITKPAGDYYFETEVSTEDEKETEPEGQTDPENRSETEMETGVDSELPYDESRYMEMLEAVRSLSRNEIESESETETEFNPEISVLSLNESGLVNIPKSGVAIYKGTFNGTDGFLMFPYDYSDRLVFDDSGLLANVSGSTVTGRFFTGDTLDLSDYHSKLYLLDSVYSAPNNLYRYGSYGVMRTYRTSTGTSLTYDSVYGNFYVSEVYIYEPQNDSHKTYLLVAGIFFVVCAVLLFRRKSE